MPMPKPKKRPVSLRPEDAGEPAYIDPSELVPPAIVGRSQQRSFRLSDDMMESIQDTLESGYLPSVRNQTEFVKAAVGYVLRYLGGGYGHTARVRDNWKRLQAIHSSTVRQVERTSVDSFLSKKSELICNLQRSATMLDAAREWVCAKNDVQNLLSGLVQQRALSELNTRPDIKPARDKAWEVGEDVLSTQGSAVMDEYERQSRVEQELEEEESRRQYAKETGGHDE